MRKKSGKGGKRPVWMNKELLSLLNHSQEIHRRWKQGQATGKEYRKVARVNKKIEKEGQGPSRIWSRTTKAK